MADVIEVEAEVPVVVVRIVSRRDVVVVGKLSRIVVFVVVVVCSLFSLALVREKPNTAMDTMTHIPKKILFVFMIGKLR